VAGLLSSAMLTELRANGKTVVPILRLYFTAGTRSYSDVGMASATLGTIYGKVIEWGALERSVSDRDNQITLNSATVQIEDTDASFSSLLEDANAGTMRGTRAVILLTSPNVSPADWATLFDGYLANWSMTGLFQWTLEISPNDQPLMNPSFPKTPILAIDWPSVWDRTLYGEFVPIIYGIHDSRGSSDEGMVPCPCVDRLQGRYLVCQGWAKDVPRVYDNASGSFLQKTVVTDYNITHPTINGRLYTLIHYVTPPAEDVEVQADVDGYEATGDGSGALLTGVDCLKHCLVNFVYGDYQGGNWASVGTVPINTTAFTAAQTFLTDMGWQKVSRRYGGEQKTSGMELIGDFCKSLQLMAFFTRAGLISVAADDHRTTTLWYDEPRWLRYDQYEVGDSFRLDYDRDSIIDRLSIQYIYSEADGKFVQTLEVRDHSITEENADELALTWSNASLA
jgi:hypothetical protein